MSTAWGEPVLALFRERIETPLHGLRWRVRLYLLLDGLVGTLAVTLLAALLQLVVDRWLRLDVAQRLALDVLIAGIIVGTAWQRLRPALRRIPEERLAQAVDRFFPGLGGRVTTAWQFVTRPDLPAESNSPQLRRAVIQEACDQARGLEFRQVLNHRLARQRALEAGLLALLMGLAFALIPHLMTTWFARNWLLADVPWPQRTYIHPEGFDPQGRRRVPRGDELEISARVIGQMPGLATLHWQAASGRRGRESMTLVGRTRLRVALGPMTETLRFHIVGGDERTREYVVELTQRPRIERAVARIMPPSYTGLLPTEQEQIGSLEVPIGSRLEIELWSSKPLASARLVGPGGPVGQCTLVEPQRIALHWDHPQAGAYTFELRDADGWDNQPPTRSIIRTLPDRPPLVRLECSGVGEMVTPRAEIPLRLSVQDDYGVGAVRLEVQGEHTSQDLALPEAAPSQREYGAEVVLNLADYPVQAGQRLRLLASARDTDPAGPNVAAAEPRELRVVSAEEFLAEMARRELQLRRDFEQVISAQRGLADALERLLATLPEGVPAAAAAQTLGALARRQDGQAGRCLVVRRGFEQILDEMYTSQVAKADDQRRVGERIISPLGVLAREVLPAAAAEVGALREGIAPDSARQVRERQRAILQSMQEILANMLERENYLEAVQILREIIGQQTDVHRATLEAIERRLAEILESDEEGSEPGATSRPVEPRP